MNQFGKFKKIDAHTHIGAFGSPFNIDFNTERLLEQMAEYNIEKTVLCSASAYSNDGSHRGTINLTMTGLWRIHLTVKDAEGNVVAGGDDLSDGYSSLFWDVTI